MKGDVSQNLVKITHWIQLHKTHPNSCITTVKVTQSSVWRVSPSMESVQTRVVHVKIFYPWPALFNKHIVIDPHHVGGGVEELYATPVVNGQSWSQPFTLKSHHLLPICGKYIYIYIYQWLHEGHLKSGWNPLVRVVVMVAFSSLVMILGICSTIHSPPALFFLKWRLACTHTCTL